MTLPTSGLITVNDRGARAATTFGSVAAAGGNMVFIKKLTASSSATLTFHDGTSSVVFDSTYKEYVFTFNNIHAQTDGANFLFQANAAGGSGFNETVTSTIFEAFHAEDDGNAGLGYSAGRDSAQGTSFLHLNCGSLDADNDSCLAGTLRIFNPSSTTFVKHFIGETNNKLNGSETDNSFTAGYFNTTSAIDEVQFKMNSGNIDAGDICLYGIL